MWFVTTLEKLECDDLGLPEFGCPRTPLFCAKEEDAVRSLNTNRGDMWETIYNYAVIEYFEPDRMYGGCSNYRRRWFQFNREKDGYFEIQEPDFMAHFMNIGIG